MGKVSQQRRSRQRMTQFNIKKYLEFQKEVIKLRHENEELATLQNSNSQEMELALQKQRDFFSEKHKAILKEHSEKLKDFYRTNFNEAITFYKSEITSLNEKLSLTKQKLISSNIKRPIFSPGKFSYSPIDLSTIPIETSTIRGYTRVPNQQPNKSVSWTIPGD